MAFQVLVLSFLVRQVLKHHKVRFWVKKNPLAVGPLPPLSYSCTPAKHTPQEQAYTKQHSIRSVPSYLTHSPHFTSKGFSCCFCKDLMFDEPPGAPGILLAFITALWTHGGKEILYTHKQPARQTWWQRRSSVKALCSFLQRSPSSLDVPLSCSTLWSSAWVRSERWDSNHQMDGGCNKKYDTAIARNVRLVQIVLNTPDRCHRCWN